VTSNACKRPLGFPILLSRRKTGFLVEVVEDVIRIGDSSTRSKSMAASSEHGSSVEKRIFAEQTSSAIRILLIFSFRGVSVFVAFYSRAKRDRWGQK